ncbi:hypothetical protein K9823_003628 [Vibrio cholerae]|nr:hypothetical protein [Vibrio cholerae]EJL6912793.1 hypothetical protein [Vibrio cholerae]
MELNFRAKGSDRKEHDLSYNDAKEYANWIGIERYIPHDRYSLALVADIHFHEKFFGICPEEILDAIADNEDPNRSTGIKTATEFRKLPLKGLWHKHYFSARFIGHNLWNQTRKGKLEKLVREVYDPKISPVVTEAMCEEFAKRLVSGSLEERQGQNKLTGEWIIFAKHKGNNYYLCLGTHNGEDKWIRNKIELVCTKEFSFLKELLASQQDG